MYLIIVLFYFVLHMHGYALLTTCITIQPLCNNLAACCYWKLYKKWYNFFNMQII